MEEEGSYHNKHPTVYLSFVICLVHIV